MADLSKYTDENIIDVLSSDAEAELRNRGYDYGWFKKDKFVGCIYILVNPAFKDLVKIGYADDVQKRLKTLNSNSGLPDPFHCFAIYKVRKRLEDLRLHDLLDSLDSTLRHSKNREFFEMDADKAYGVLSAIAQINGDEEQLVKNPFDDEYFYQSKVTNRDTLSGIRSVVDSIVTNDNKEISLVTPSVPGSLPDGFYTCRCVNKQDKSLIVATASVKDNCWTLLKGSIVRKNEMAGLPDSAREFRKKLQLSSDNVLLEDIELGLVTPSFAGSVVYAKSLNGWTEWKDSKGQEIDIYRR